MPESGKQLISHSALLPLISYNMQTTNKPCTVLNYDSRNLLQSINSAATMENLITQNTDIGISTEVFKVTISIVCFKKFLIVTAK